MGASLSVKYDTAYPGFKAALPIVKRAAVRFSIPSDVIAGIISRESGFGRLLSKNLTGDGGHGRGLMQIDDRYHPVNSFDWKDPETNINYGANLLSSYRREAVNSGVPKGDALRVALAGYNGGVARAIKKYKAGLDPDAITTGKNYSRDVLQRAWLFKPFLKDQKKNNHDGTRAVDTVETQKKVKGGDGMKMDLDILKKFLDPATDLKDIFADGKVEAHEISPLLRVIAESCNNAADVVDLFIWPE